MHLRHEPGRGQTADPRRATLLPHRVLNAAGRRDALGSDAPRLPDANSGMTLGVGVDHVLDTAARAGERRLSMPTSARPCFTADARPGVPIRIIKYITYQSSRSAPSAELVARCGRTLDRAIRDGARRAARVPAPELDRFWDSADVRLTSAQPRRGSSRRSAGTCSSSARRPGVSRDPASRRRVSRRRPTRGTTSGTPRSTSFRSCPTRSRGSPATCCASATACSRERALARASSTSAAPCSRGERSTATRRPPRIRPARPSTTSMPTSRSRSGAT